MKTIEGILFSVFHIMFTKKMQGIFSKFFVLRWKFSDFVPRTSSTLRNFPMLFTLGFWQLSDALRKRLKFHINVQQGLKNIWMGCWIWPFIGLPSHPYFVPPIQVSYLGCDYYIWNRLEALKTMLLPLAKNESYTNWFGSFHFGSFHLVVSALRSETKGSRFESCCCLCAKLSALQ